MLRSLLLLISFCCVLTNLYGASVTARSKKKLLVKIDEGGDTGFSKGLKVCFYNASGKKLGCGKIVSAGDSSSRVRVSKRTVRRLKKGVTAKLANIANSATAVVLAASENMKLRFFYLLTPVQGYQINQLSYLPPGNLPAQSLWATTEVSKSSFVGGGLDFEIPMKLIERVAISKRKA